MFYEDVLRSLMQKTDASELILLFLDASHFVMECDFLGCIYGTVRRFVVTFSVRKRYYILRAIDYATEKS